MEQARHSAALQEAAREYPVTFALSRWSGVGSEQIDLAVSLTFSLVLEGLACLCWFLTMRPKVRSQATPEIRRNVEHVRESPASATGQASRRDAMSSASPVSDAESNVTTASNEVATNVDLELSQLLASIASGTVRPTVSSIRKHLRCWQARASDLRRRLAAASPGDTAPLS
jgi:hypothetical protein